MDNKRSAPVLSLSHLENKGVSFTNQTPPPNTIAQSVLTSPSHTSIHLLNEQNACHSETSYTVGSKDTTMSLTPHQPVPDGEPQKLDWWLKPGMKLY